MDLSKIIKGVGMVAGAINPAVGNGLVMVGDVLKSFDVDDDVLEKNIVGLSKSAEIVRDVADNLDGDDRDKLLSVADNLESINNLIFKFEKIIK